MQTLDSYIAFMPFSSATFDTSRRLVVIGADGRPQL
jgi:hypothetical protein